MELRRNESLITAIKCKSSIIIFLFFHFIDLPLCSSVNDLYDCLKAGSENRAVAGHALNAQSSRSHAVSFALRSIFEISCGKFCLTLNRRDFMQ